MIAVTGTMGCGKTTLTESLVAALPNCQALFEDDFNPTTDRSLSDIDRWWNAGADVGDLDLGELPDRLAAVMGSDGATHSRSEVSGSSLVLLETHFGRLHPLLKPWIGLQVWLDVPADIAIARKVAQLCGQFQRECSAEVLTGRLHWIEQFCRGYLTTTRRLFQMQRQQVQPLSDIVIDGTAEPLDVLGSVLNELPEEIRRQLG